MARRKQYRGPKPVRNPIAMRIKVNMVFGPIEHALSELLRTGEVEADAAGNAIFTNHIDGEAYDLAAAMAGVVTMFEMWEARHSRQAPIAAMNVMCACMAGGKPVTEWIVQRTFDSLPALRHIALKMGEDEAADLVQQTQIAVAMELAGT